jgi:tetratricopeptide (TPR) repeat protein
MRRFSAPAAATLLLGLVLSGARPVCADSTAAKNNEGNRLYNDKKYDEALKMYIEAQASRPQAPELHYNIGNVLFRKGEYDKAVEEYMRAQAAKDPALAESAAYNRGNAFLAQHQLPQAVNSYIQALRADPGDQDAKRNLELALQLIQEQKKQQKQQQNQKPEDKNDPTKPPPQTPQQAQKKGDEKTPRQPRPGEMSEEEARQILEALRQEEKEGIKKHVQAAAPQSRAPEKDW